MALSRQKRWPRRCCGGARRQRRSTPSSASNPTECASRPAARTSSASAAIGRVRCTACRSCSRTISTRPIIRRRQERPASRRTVRNAMPRSCSACSTRVRLFWAKPICKSWPMDRPATTRRLARCAIPTIRRAFRAARAAAPEPRSPPGLRLPGFAASPASVQAPCAGRRPALYRSRILATRADGAQRRRLCAARCRRDGGSTVLAPVDLSGLRLGVPRGYFWDDLDAELAQILEGALARLREAGVVLVEGDLADVVALDAAAGFPIALYEFVTDLERYLAEHQTGLDFAGMFGQVKSPAVRKALAGLVGADAVSEAT